MKARGLSRRGRAWLRQWLIAWDQLALVALCFVPFVLLGRGLCPDADETISSYVGRHAQAGKRWALAAEWVIDRLFVLLGDNPRHCRRSIEITRSVLSEQAPNLQEKLHDLANDGQVLCSFKIDEHNRSLPLTG